MVVAGVFVPHQLWVAVTVLWLLFRFAPDPEVRRVLLARRLNEMTVGPPPLSLPVATPAPPGLALLFVIVTLERMTVSAPNVAARTPPPKPVAGSVAWLLSIN